LLAVAIRLQAGSSSAALAASGSSLDLGSRANSFNLTVFRLY